MYVGTSSDSFEISTDKKKLDHSYDYNLKRETRFLICLLQATHSNAHHQTNSLILRTLH